MRRLLAVLVMFWTAALPAHVPVLICFCGEDGDDACGHGSDGNPGRHGHSPAPPESGIGGALPLPCHCHELKSSHDLAPGAVSADPGACEAAAGSHTAPSGVGAVARLAPPATPRAVGPPIFLRIQVLLV